MPTHPAYKVRAGWRDGFLKLARQGHPVQAICNVMHVGYDRLVQEKTRDAEFAAQVEEALQEGSTKPKRRGTF